MKELLEWGTLTPEAAELLEKLVAGGSNIFISGGTSSGKTTLLNVLSGFIPCDERIVVIEDSAELQIQSVENIVRMECRNANVQGKGEVTIRQLIRASLRMRPDRIIVGEVRGEEVMDMLQAMNTGHDGSLSTGHGNSPLGMLSRLEAMYLTAASLPIDAVRGQIAEAIDIIVHLGRMPDKSRKVLEIVEVEGFDQGRYIINPLFYYDRAKGLIPTGNRLKNTTKAELKGISL
jgi:pilus assembly protein CpaF